MELGFAILAFYRGKIEWFLRESRRLIKESRARRPFSSIKGQTPRAKARHP
jgi:hypothetical protein